MRLLALALAGCLATPDRPPGFRLLGDQHTEACFDHHPSGIAEASSFLATADGSVTSLSVDLATADADQLVIALYDDNSVSLTPGYLLATATVQGLSMAGATYRGKTDNHPRITSGTRYWISAFCTGGSGCDVLYTFFPGEMTSCCDGDPCAATIPPCTPDTTSCTVHSLTSDLTQPEAQWSPGGPLGGFSVNSFWASDD